MVIVFWRNQYVDYQWYEWFVVSLLYNAQRVYFILFYRFWEKLLLDGGLREVFKCK